MTLQTNIEHHGLQCIHTYLYQSINQNLFATHSISKQVNKP